MPRRRLLLLAATLVVLVAGAVPFVRRGTRDPTELTVYTMGAQRMRAGEEIYRPSDAKPFTYPPFFAVPFVLLPAPPESPPRPALPYVLWYVVNLAVLAAIIALVHRMIFAPGAPPIAPLVFWMATGVLSARHVTAVFENQSHDLLVALLVTLGAAAWCRGGELRAGAWFGVAAACKATPLLFTAAFVVQRRALALLSLLVAVAAATLLPDLLFPRQDGRAWVAAWAGTMLSGLRPDEAAASEGMWMPGSALNQSLSGTIHRLLTPTVDVPSGFVRNVALFDAGEGGRRAATLVASAAVLALLALVLWPRRRDPSDPRAAPDPRLRLGHAGAVACGMVLLSPMSSKSHFCVLLLPFAYAVARWLETRPRDQVLGALLLSCLVLGPGTMKGTLGTDLGGLVLAYGPVTWTALLALLAVGRAQSLGRAPSLGREPPLGRAPSLER